MIIGITGKKRSGKDSFSEALFKESGKATVLHFATPVKTIAAILLGKYSFYFMEDKRKDEPFIFSDGKMYTGREILQRVGTEAIRDNISKSVWIDNMRERIKNVPHGNIVIIPDVRFENEAKFVKDFGGIIVRVERENHVSEDDHSSEMDMDKISPDFTYSFKDDDDYKKEMELSAQSLLNQIDSSHQYIL